LDLYSLLSSLMHGTMNLKYFVCPFWLGESNPRLKAEINLNCIYKNSVPTSQRTQSYLTGTMKFENCIEYIHNFYCAARNPVEPSRQDSCFCSSPDIGKGRQLQNQRDSAPETR
jgi:hypothetical protein